MSETKKRLTFVSLFCDDERLSKELKMSDPKFTGNPSPQEIAERIQKARRFLKFNFFYFYAYILLQAAGLFVIVGGTLYSISETWGLLRVLGVIGSILLGALVFLPGFFRYMGPRGVILKEIRQMDKLIYSGFDNRAIIANLPPRRRCQQCTAVVFTGWNACSLCGAICE